MGGVTVAATRMGGTWNRNLAEALVRDRRPDLYRPLLTLGGAGPA